MRSPMKYSASKNQIHAIKRKLKEFGDAGDFSGFLRAQSMLRLFCSDDSIEAIASDIGKSHECVRLWLCDFLEKGVKSLKLKLRSGRQPKLSKSQCKELKELISNSPSCAGYDGGCWNAAMICDLIEKLFKAKYSAKYLPQLLKRIGLSYQKAKFLAAKADSVKRDRWINETWPKILRKAKRTKAMVFFGDEASFALWGSLSYTWAAKGRQPLIPTNGNRKSLKVFGMIDYFSGKLIYQVIDGKLTGESYIKFLKKVLNESSEKVIIVQDGAPYHKSRLVKDYTKDNSKRLSVYSLPAYSPDYNPIEFLWRKIKRSATHNVFFEDFKELTGKVRKQLQKLKRSPKEIKNLFGVYEAQKA